jgi:predicted house-cleaning NTP pyrophosphatase (Maf/HAM1 superfamily)
MWPFSRKPPDPEKTRLRAQHAENMARRLAEAKARQAACAHEDTHESPWDGHVYCVNCGLTDP